MADWAGAFEALGAGLQGKGNEYMLVQEEQKKRQEELSLERKKAWILDMDQAVSLAEAGDVGAAQSLFQDRLSNIEKLGGDPQHTAGMLRLLQEGKVGEFVAGAKPIVQRGKVEFGITTPEKYKSVKQQPDGSFVGLNSQTGQIEKIPTAEGLALVGESAGPKVMKASDVDESGQYFVINPETGAVEAKRVEGFTPPKKEPEKPKDAQPQINKLRDSVKDSVKSSKAVETQYMKLKSSLQSGTAAGDMSAVFAYMKMLDPASTVREGEQAQARQAAGVPSQIIAQYNKLVSGETLTPEMRQDFLARGGEIFDAEQYIADRSIYEILQQAEQDGLTAVQILGKQRSNDFAKRWEGRQNKDKQKKKPAPQQQSIIQFLGFENQAGGQ